MICPYICHVIQTNQNRYEYDEEGRNTFPSILAGKRCQHLCQRGLRRLARWPVHLWRWDGMLTPRYLESAPDAMVDLYSEVEADILADYGGGLPDMIFSFRRRSTNCVSWRRWVPNGQYILRRLANSPGEVRRSCASSLGCPAGRPWSVTRRTTGGRACILRPSTRPRSSSRCSAQGFGRPRASLPT